MIGFSLSDAIGISRFSLSHLPARFLLLQQPLAFDLIGEGKGQPIIRALVRTVSFDLFSASAAVRGDAPATTSLSKSLSSSGLQLRLLKRSILR